MASNNSGKAPGLEAAGAIRQTVSHVWNKEGAFMLGNMWEYIDEKAFIECQKLFREAEKSLMSKLQSPPRILRQEA